MMSLYEEHRLNEEIARKEDILRKHILGCKALNFAPRDKEGQEGLMMAFDQMAKGLKVHDLQDHIITIIGGETVGEESLRHRLVQSNDFMKEILLLQSLQDLCNQTCFEGLGDGLAIRMEQCDHGKRAVEFNHFSELTTRGLFIINDSLCFREIGVNGIRWSEAEVVADSIVMTDALGQRFAYPIEKGSWTYYDELTTF